MPWEKHIGSTGNCACMQVSEIQIALLPSCTVLELSEVYTTITLYTSALIKGDLLSVKHVVHILPKGKTFQHFSKTSHTLQLAVSMEFQLYMYLGSRIPISSMSTFFVCSLCHRSRGF